MFSKKEKNNLQTKSKNLWINICTYQSDAAKRLLKSWEYDTDKIIEQLQDFPELNSYSGHRSGKKGSGVNQSAMTVLKNAIDYLNDCLTNKTNQVTL